MFTMKHLDAVITALMFGAVLLLAQKLFGFSMDATAYFFAGGLTTQAYFTGHRAGEKKL